MQVNQVPTVDLLYFDALYSKSHSFPDQINRRTLHFAKPLIRRMKEISV